MLIDVQRAARAARSPRVRVTAAVGGVLALLVALQAAAMRAGFQGPLHSLISDYLATPTSSTVTWTGLGLAMVGLPNRYRIAALSLAAAIDIPFAAARLVLGGQLALGNGPLIVLTGLAALVGLRWSGEERAVALRAVGWGFVLIVATKCADAWLKITTATRPRVLDEYAMVADHALGQPSWLVGRLVEAGGPVSYAVLHWIYIELPVAVMVVAVYQLRNVTGDGWPQHHLLRTFITAGLIGPAIYLIFPVVGPMYAFGADGQGFEVADYWPHLLPPVFAPHTVVFDGVTARNCMPSMHIAWALMVFVHSRGGPRWLRWGGTLWLVGTALATLGFGYHYGVDLVAGVVLCLTVEAALRDPRRGWDSARIRLVAAGATLVTLLLVCYRYLAVPMAQVPQLSGPLLLGAMGVFVAAFYGTFFGWSRIGVFGLPELAPAGGEASGAGLPNR